MKRTFLGSTIGTVSGLQAALDGKARISVLARNAKDAGAAGDGSTNDTVALNGFFTDCLANQRHAYIPRGRYKASQLVIPSKLTVEGSGIGGFGALADESGTMLWQIAGSNVSFVVFTAASGTNVGPVEVSRLLLFGDQTATSGSGIAFQTAAGVDLTIQDTVSLHHLLVEGFKDDGIRIPFGARPLHLADINCLWNGGYGINFVSAANLMQSVHFDNISGDGNLLGLIRCKGVDDRGSLTFTNTKSEKRVNSLYASAVGQEDALIFEDCADTPVSISGLTHISSVPDGGNFQKPRAAIWIKGTGTPRVAYEGVAVRVRSGDTGTAYTLKDDVNTVTVPTSKTAGRYGGTDGALAWFDAPPADADDLAAAESTMRRKDVVSSASTGSGNLRLAYFTAKKDRTITTTRTLVLSGGTAAGATPTLCRVGIFSVAANGDLTLIGSTPNDTALWAATNTRYTKALSASCAVIAGRRYAFGVLVVTGATAPTLAGNSALVAAEAGESPRLGGLVSSQSDLPSSVAAGSVGDTGQLVYGVLA